MSQLSAESARHHIGHHPNIGLSNQPHEDITNSDPEAYGMRINSLLRQVRQRVPCKQRSWP